jgi:hypothetical protein
VEVGVVHTIPEVTDRQRAWDKLQKPDHAMIRKRLVTI